MAFGAAHAATFGAGDAVAFGVADAATFGAADAVRVGVADAVAFGPSDAAALGAADDTAFGTPDAAEEVLASAAAAAERAADVASSEMTGGVVDVDGVTREVAAGTGEDMALGTTSTIGGGGGINWY